MRHATHLTLAAFALALFLIPRAPSRVSAARLTEETSMRITRETLRGRAALAAAAFTLLAVCLCGPAPAGAQWTQPDANNNINNTNAGKVGIGTTAPDSKLVVSGNAATPPAPQAGSVLHLVNADSTKTRLT